MPFYTLACSGMTLLALAPLPAYSKTDTDPSKFKDVHDIPAQSAQVQGLMTTLQQTPAWQRPALLPRHLRRFVQSAIMHDVPCIDATVCWNCVQS